MNTTKLSTESILPLTCSRSGSCCFGKAVMLNPWEVLSFSREKKITAREFRDLYCEFGGIRLIFNGKTDKKGQKACSQYVDNFGCSVHLGRPLACRLYPLGRQIQFDKANYIYEGKQFPCLTDCAEVLDLPQLSVGEYLKGQKAEPFEIAQDEYLKIMQGIADIGFELLLDTGLAVSGDTKTLAAWRKSGNEKPELLAQQIGSEWLDYLMIPQIDLEINDPIIFAQKHNEFLMSKIQEQFGGLQTFEEVHEASVLLIAVALHLSRGLGADTKGIAEHWVETAKSHGAKE
ncbi:YkgJ family cysteine cluster protein [Flammeovirga kamogawensis]|uniref:YkgJ family cysteine cluster protein n=1 Tax=Flammeovirga kamogawensis TaxID=373891 RepID=A0ABX8GT98_9BACT|nr:YkgJ family cysteine cluster protein [Flammeovirga kamogawensis]MBB6462442.1 Fe-S-cluster containining protein [Flammeovirga kamogawensis]QWG06820.1 YkgJ family cysteine cluster protein [Flammeovirga kamogawensis]TRX68643.1 YkgJ family cysteine cluster protein [Flammeovirga kamogawensis]